jgi:hypothetical protein
VRERQTVLADLVYAVRQYRTLAEKQPLTLQGSDYAHAVQELNKAIDRAERFVAVSDTASPVSRFEQTVCCRKNRPRLCFYRSLHR